MLFEELPPQAESIIAPASKSSSFTFCPQKQCERGLFVLLRTLSLANVFMMFHVLET